MIENAAGFRNSVFMTNCSGAAVLPLPQRSERFDLLDSEFPNAAAFNWDGQDDCHLPITAGPGFPCWRMLAEDFQFLSLGHEIQAGDWTPPALQTPYSGEVSSGKRGTFSIGYGQDGARFRFQVLWPDGQDTGGYHWLMPTIVIVGTRQHSVMVRSSARDVLAEINGRLGPEEYDTAIRRWMMNPEFITDEDAVRIGAWQWDEAYHMALAAPRLRPSSKPPSDARVRRFLRLISAGGARATAAARAMCRGEFGLGAIVENKRRHNFDMPSLLAAAACTYGPEALEMARRLLHAAFAVTLPYERIYFLFGWIFSTTSWHSVGLLVLHWNLISLEYVKWREVCKELTTRVTKTWMFPGSKTVTTRAMLFFNAENMGGVASSAMRPARGRGRGGGASSSGRDEGASASVPSGGPRCYYCDQLGHIQRECALFQQERPEEFKQYIHGSLEAGASAAADQRIQRQRAKAALHSGGIAC